MVAHWVVLRPIFGMCERETSQEEGGRRRDAWRRKEATETHHRATIKEILQEYRRRRQGERDTQ